MPYDKFSFLAGLAVGRNMKSIPYMEAGMAGLFSFTIDTTLGNTSLFSFQLVLDSVGSAVTIAWGDGSTTQGSNGRNTHAYAVAGVYRVLLVGVFASVHFGNDALSDAYSKSLIEVNTPFSISQYHNDYRISLYCMFRGCSNLKKIPNRLLDDYYENGYVITSIGRFFEGCSSLTAVPPDVFRGMLFDSEEEPFGVSLLFGGCSSLKNVSPNQFDSPQFQNCINGEDIFSFSGIRKLPDALFRQFINCTNFHSVCGRCPDLVEIGNEVFAGCEKVITFDTAFAYCSSLEIIGSAVFNGCDAVQNFNNTFLGCSALETLPPDLISLNLPTNPTFRSCFYGDSSITSALPALWTSYTTESRNECFGLCTNASNYFAVPNYWR